MLVLETKVVLADVAHQAVLHKLMLFSYFILDFLDL